MAWEANIDIQPAINHFISVSHVGAYLSKKEDECSHAMTQAVKEAWQSKSNNYDQTKLIARAYASKRECSVQEAVYHIIPKLWLRKVFPAVLFANTSLPENRYRVCVREKEINSFLNLPQIFSRQICWIGTKIDHLVNLELGNIQL